MLAALAANAIPSRRAMRTEWPHKVAWRQANFGLAGDDMVPGCSSAQWQSAASIDWPGQAIIVCSCEAVRTTQRSGSCTCGSDLQQIAKRGGRRARHYACALNGARGLSLPLAPMPAIQQFAQRSQKRTLNPPLAGCATSSAVGCIASPRSNPSNDCRLAPQSSRRSVDPLVSSYENPTQALQLPYVAIQGDPRKGRGIGRPGYRIQAAARQTQNRKQKSGARSPCVPETKRRGRAKYYGTAAVADGGDEKPNTCTASRRLTIGTRQASKDAPRAMSGQRESVGKE